MQPIDPNKPNIALRYRTLLTLWFAMFMSQIMYLVFIQLAAFKTNANQRLTVVLICVGLVPAALSFLLKQIILARSVESQRVESVQVAYVVAWALCEIPALLGLVDHFVTGSSYYYLAFVVAGLGILLHFPQRKHLLAASDQQF
jgi:hypothetical protein